MVDKIPLIDISFNNIRIVSAASNSGVFAGRNFQHLWCSDSDTQAGFGRIIGEENTLESPYNIITDPDSSSELLDYLELLVRNKLGKRGM